MHLIFNVFGAGGFIVFILLTEPLFNYLLPDEDPFDGGQQPAQYGFD